MRPVSDSHSALTDPDRLAALRETGLLDRDPDPALQRLTRLATRLLGAPVGLVSLVDEDRQYFAGHQGLDEPWASEQQTPLSHSFCKHVVMDGAPLVVGNAPDHPVVAGNPAIEELSVTAYLGTPLTTPDKQVLGSFCVADAEAREWSEDDLELLQELAEAAVTEIELRRTASALAEALERIRSLQELVPVCAWCRRIRDDSGFWDSLEGYLEAHQGAQVSHGVCPDCARELEGEADGP